jgi:ATP-binding cassette subfamily B protein
MIRVLLRVLGHEHARPLRRTVALMTAAAVAEGLSYALLVPLLRALLGPAPEDAWPWLTAFGAAVAACAVLRYLGDLSGFRVGAALLHGMYHRLGGHLARLPVGWYDTNRLGELSVLAGRGVLQAMSAVAHLLAPFVSACVTPLTIVAVMLCFSWQAGLAALVAVPVVAAVDVRAGRSTAAGDAERAERDHEATARVIEYLQAQPVLRAGGRTTERFRWLDDSLRDLRRASRRSVLSALPGAVGLTLTVQAVFTALLALGAHLALVGDLGAAEALAILVLAARCADPLLSLTDIGGKLRSARHVLARRSGRCATTSRSTPSSSGAATARWSKASRCPCRRGSGSPSSDRPGRARAPSCTCSHGSTTWTRARCAWAAWTYATSTPRG